MSLPALLEQRLRLPLVAAPMFLVSNPALVSACCNAGVVGSFPALNQRESAGFRAWLDEIEASLSAEAAPFAVNLIVHQSNPRLQADLAICGGAESKLNPIGLMRQSLLNRLTETHNDDPASALRPFDEDADGTTVNTTITLK